MKALKYIRPVWLFIAALLLVSCGRNIQEQSFVQEVNEMLAWPEGGVYSDEVMQSVFDYIRNNPLSLDYEFEDEQSHIRVATSDDGNVRAYNLERCGFAGNPSSGFECKTLLQYRSGEKIYCEEFDNFDGYVTRICHVDSNYYILEIYQGYLAQGTHEMYNLYVYKAENNKLHKMRGGFANRDGIIDNLALSWFDYGGFIEIDSTFENSSFVYSRSRKELYVLKGMPQVRKALKYYQYNWNGQCFELRKYDEPLEYYNDKYFIRIEPQGDNSWTYKCWNDRVKHGEPALTIKGGTKQYWLYGSSFISYDEWVTDDSSTPLGEKYTFFNNGYRYEYFDGWSRGERVELLYVYDPNENIVYYGDFTPVLHYEDD